MALFGFLAQKKARLEKSKLKTKPTLGISPTALHHFSKQALKISNIEISSSLLSYYECEDISQIQNVIKSLKPNSAASLEETIRLMLGFIAIQTTKSYIPNQRTEQENDYLVAVEVFPHALETIPDQDTKRDIISRITWDSIRCDILSLDFSINVEALQFINLAKQFNLPADHALPKIGFKIRKLLP